jgi:hypothetical protein
MVPTQPTLKRRDTVRVCRARRAEAMARAAGEVAPRSGLPAWPQ